MKHNLELTRIKDVVDKVSIYLDPTNSLETTIEEDKGIMEIYKVLFTPKST